MSEPEAAAEPLHPGERLGRARQAMGIARGDIAASLHLEEDVLAALEEGREDGLPSQAYVRGYMRAYARLVGLDPEQLVVPLDGPASRRSSRPALGQPPPPLRSFAERAQRHMGLLLGGIVALMLIAAAAVLWFAWRSADWPFAGAPASPAVAVVVDGAADAAPSPVVVRGAGPAGLSAGPDPDRLAAERAAVLAPPAANSAATATAVPPPGGTLASDLPPPSTNPSAIPSAAVRGAGSANSSASLSFRFSDDSWVEVRDGAGGILHEDLARTGEVLALGGEPPFTILLGYAPGVRLAFNGNPVALGPHTHRNIARLVVGH